jgi:2-polyprenyl-6-methoxyphenol hydroxylase-like FAD-dependent oxidoreductase
MTDTVGEHAVILGGSMAGLLAARVLSEFYGDVTIVDRDKLITASSTRRGVPQGFHAHALLARGKQILDELFPEIADEMVAAGMPMLDMGEMHWYLNGMRLRNAHTGLVAVSLTRPALEKLVRGRVAAIPNVHILEEHDILGLTATAGGQTVTGAQVKRHGTDEAPTRLTADLVVDATGRGSRSAGWLAELGYEPPAEDRIKIDLAYTTCEFMLPSRPLENDLSIISLGTPMYPGGAFFGRVRGDRHHLSLTSMLGNHPSTDTAGVKEFARSLPVPRIYDAIRDIEPAAGPAMIRVPASVRRRYEWLARFPARFLIVGDSVCSFNPVYGQGMTVAALEALALREHLRDGSVPRASQFFRDIAAVIDTPWAMAASSDLSWPGVEGPRTAEGGEANEYMGQVMAGMLHDGEITNAFMRVAGLIDPPEALLRPSVRLRVERAAKLPLPGPAAAAEELGRSTERVA